MDDLRSTEESLIEIQSLRKRIRILLIIVLLLIILSVTLGYCSYSCLTESECPEVIVTKTSAPLMTLPSIITMTPSKTANSTPTSTRTPTPDLGATATQACSDFLDQFPGTPCP